MTSGWFINNIELPVAPSTESKAINRSFQQESVFRNFPVVFEPVVVSYNYTLTGYIYGALVITQLEQLAKSADTEIVAVVPPVNRLESTVLSTGVFAVSNFTVNRDAPMFTEFNNRTEIVYKYSLVLTQFAEQGVNNNSIESETISGEEFTGTVDELIQDDVNLFGGAIDQYVDILTDVGLTF